MSALCRIEMLGGLRVFVSGRAITRFQTQKTGALLAYLALHPNRMHAREALAELLWPGDDPVAIRNRLNQAVSSLRRQLHPPGIEAGSALQADHHTISVNSQNVETDIETFRRAMRAAIDDEEPAKQIARLEQAVELYKGDLLSGYYEDWVLSERLFLTEQYIEALDRLIKLYVETGAPERAIDLASKRLEADPLDESGHLRLMRLYLRLNRPRAALRQFDDLKRVMAADEDEPSEAAERLASKAKLLAADSADEMTPWAEASDAPKETHAPLVEHSAIEHGSTVPRFFTRFVGRDSELERLDEWLIRGDGLATIVGVGGCGKTRLAAEFAATIDGRRDVIWVSLASVDDAEQILMEVAVSSGADRFTVGEPRQALVGLLGKKKSPVVVLDNLEHLVDEPGFDIKPLLNCRKDLHVLATSRRALEFEGELVMTLSPLPIPKLDATTTLQDLAANPSVDLFVSRAQSVKQDFQLTDRTAGAISGLCQRLEGLPLAIELAASWARSLTPSQMLEEVTKRLDFLATRRRDISERHRSMRAAIDSSFDLLSPELKDLFIRLSVFSGGWTHQSVRAIATEIDVEEALDELSRRSLIISKSGGDATRFSMLELLRAYAESKATPDLQSEIEWLHANYFVDFVVESERMINGEGARRVDGELLNVLASLRFLIRSEAWPQALLLGETLGGYFEYRGQIREGLAWMLEIERNSSRGDPLTLAKLRRRIATLSWSMGDFDRVVAMLDLAIPVLRKLGSPADMIDALFARRLESHRLQDFTGSIQLGEEILELAKTSGDELNQANAMRQISNSLVELGRQEEALDGYRQSLEIGRKLENSDVIGFALLNMGYLSIRLGRHEAAETWLSEAETILVDAGRTSQHFDVLVSQLQLARVKGDETRAIELIRRIMSWEIEGWIYQWESFSTVGQYFASIKQFEIGTKVLGFARSVLESASGGASKLLIDEFEAALDLCRGALGDRFGEAYSIGHSMTLEQARRLATESSVLEPI